MNWKQQWIAVVLAKIPAGGYRKRTEAELYDHLETQCRALMETGKSETEAQAETLRAMGEPDKLRDEYRAAWKRSLSGQLEEWRYRLKTWAGGCAVMLGVHWLVSWVIGRVWWMALSLPGDSQDPRIRLIRGTVGNLNNSWLRFLLPLVLALTAGAYYLRRRIQTPRRPVWQISVGLSFHWAFITAFEIWWEAADDHVTFWKELRGYLPYNAKYCAFTFALCILLGMVFGHISVRTKKPATT